ncbi:MAG: KUP/HAK/KT family potassium transporter [Saprospiraceae bacterium]|nr:KUP/HAK/KT family potassium transporter [Saprospiraceae bacterium]
MASPKEGRKLSAAGLLIALGFIFGDIGTSPLYVLKAVIGNDTVSPELIYGGLSCIFWTLLFITSFKYVYLALKADNRGEGGIFALYARVRRYRARWAIFPAMIGCATLMADGFLTPAISVSAAVEGALRTYPDLKTTPIVVGILIGIFVWQQFGAQLLAKWFGYVMLVWFCVIGGLGLGEVIKTPSVLQALNPAYAVNFVMHYKSSVTGMSGFWLLGAVFLCTTGCEALYSDLGRCGKRNVRWAWAIVLPCLMLNYLGQGAWVLQFEGQKLPETVSHAGVFFAMLPEKWVTFMVVLSVIVAVIVSEALIAGVFTMINEAIKLKLWFNMKINYPSQMRGQVYLPLINWFLLAGCLLTVLIFKKSSNMEEAYGLAIVIDMIMTSSLLLHFVHMRNQSLRRAILLGLVFGGFEIMFLVANLHKLALGGWYTLGVASLIFFGVFVYWRGQRIRKKHANFVPVDTFAPILKDVMADKTIPRTATNLVYMTMSDDATKIDSNILYSIFKKKPKRADIYWFVHVTITDTPFAQKQAIHPIIKGKVYFVNLRFGFKVEHKINRVFKEIVQKMQAEGEIDVQSHYPSLRRHDIPADFKFILLNSRVSADDALSPFEQFIVRSYRLLKKIAVPPAVDFGLEGGNFEVETVPINVAPPQSIELDRLF